jgi:hypothetical protein
MVGRAAAHVPTGKSVPDGVRVRARCERWAGIRGEAGCERELVEQRVQLRAVERAQLGADQLAGPIECAGRDGEGRRREHHSSDGLMRRPPGRGGEASERGDEALRAVRGGACHIRIGEQGR